MKSIDRSGIKTAARLLAKAESTDSDHEAIALAERSYSLLAETINAYDLAVESQGGLFARRRERRRLRDRRSVRRGPDQSVGADRSDSGTPNAADGYARIGNGTQTSRTVDFSL
jgi:hypothetical protein